MCSVKCCAQLYSSTYMPLIDTVLLPYWTPFHRFPPFVSHAARSQMEQELWAVDLDIGMRDMQSMCGLLGEVTSGGYCWKEGLFAVPGQTQGTMEEVRTYSVSVHMYMFVGGVGVCVCMYIHVCGVCGCVHVHTYL